MQYQSNSVGNQSSGQLIGTGNISGISGRSSGGVHRESDFAQSQPAQLIEAPTVIADAARSLQARAIHIHALLDRICRVTDRVFGCEPVAGCNDKPKEPQHDVDRINEAMRFLDLAIERLEYQTRRVEQV